MSNNLRQLGRLIKRSLSTFSTHPKIVTLWSTKSFFLLRFLVRLVGKPLTIEVKIPRSQLLSLKTGKIAQILVKFSGTDIDSKIIVKITSLRSFVTELVEQIKENLGPKTKKELGISNRPLKVVTYVKIPGLENFPVLEVVQEGVGYSYWLLTRKIDLSTITDPYSLKLDNDKIIAEFYYNSHSQFIPNKKYSTVTWIWEQEGEVNLPHNVAMTIGAKAVVTNKLSSSFTKLNSGLFDWLRGETEGKRLLDSLKLILEGLKSLQESEKEERVIFHEMLTKLRKLAGRRPTPFRHSGHTFKSELEDLSDEECLSEIVDLVKPKVAPFNIAELIGGKDSKKKLSEPVLYQLNLLRDTMGRVLRRLERAKQTSDDKKVTAGIKEDYETLQQALKSYNKEIAKHRND